MKTYTANAIAEAFERDRGVVVRALRNTKPDAMISGKPQWKIATAATALEKHRNGGGNSGGIAAKPPEYAALDLAYDKMVALPTLAQRRKRAVQLVPLINAMIAALTAHGRAAGEDPEVTGLRGDKVYQLTLLGFEGPCEWSHDQVWDKLALDTDADAA